MSAQLIFEPMRPSPCKLTSGRRDCKEFARRESMRRSWAPTYLATLPEPSSPPLGAGDPATDIQGPLPFVAVPFAPAGAQVAARSAGAIGGILLTVLMAFGVLSLAVTEPAPAAHGGSTFAQPDGQQRVVVVTGEFTGQFEDDVPVYRLPAIQVTGVRAQY
jgi:hypothetical protein